MFIFILTQIFVRDKLKMKVRRKETMAKLLKNNKGVILFYFVIILLAFVCSYRLNSLTIANEQNEIKQEVRHCA